MKREGKIKRGKEATQATGKTDNTKQAIVADELDVEGRGGDIDRLAVGIRAVGLVVQLRTHDVLTHRRRVVVGTVQLVHGARGHALLRTCLAGGH